MRCESCNSPSATVLCVRCATWARHHLPRFTFLTGYARRGR